MGHRQHGPLGALLVLAGLAACHHDVAFLRGDAALPPGDGPPGTDAGDAAPRDVPTDAPVSDAGVSIEPGGQTLLPSTAARFVASIPGAADSRVTWSVVEPAGGSVSSDGLYSAPSTEGSYHVRATSVADNTLSATVTVAVTAAPPAVDIADVGTIANATGHGQQRHLIRTAAGEWWYFFDSSAQPNALGSAHSGDFLTWAAGESAMLPAPHASDGRDLSVAYRALGGADVVHITQGSATNHGRFHIRATVTPGHVAYGPVQLINQGDGTDPDGTDTTILADGTVLDVTGWQPTPQRPPLGPCGAGDAMVYESNLRDDGTAAAQSPTFTGLVLWCVPNLINTRQLLTDGTLAMYLFEDAVSEPDATNILTALRLADGTWLPQQPSSGAAVMPTPVFSANASFAINDWTAVWQGGQVHAVRRVDPAMGRFEHRVYEVLGRVWRDGGDVPMQPGPADSGLFLAPYGAGLILFSLAADGANSVRYAFWDGQRWNGWTTVLGAIAARTNIAGSDSAASGRPAVLWTEARGASYVVRGIALP
jgi:hypothetical protein